MLWKLQKKTLIPAQIVGYFFTLLIGIAIILTVIQLYLDVKPLLFQQSDVFKNNATIVSKNISVFKTLDKNKIYFTKQELEEIKQQPFVKNIALFNNAGFKIKAFTRKSANVPAFYTDLFFESIPDVYLDVVSEDWTWNPELDFIPIIIPETYLNLYNFGFAESQNLPVISKNTISQLEFNIELYGNGQKELFRSKIVGFSNQINSILVPEAFLLWANEEFGSEQTNTVSRILVEFNNPSDERILSFFNDNNYAVNKQDLEFNKLTFFFKSALFFVLFVAITIIVLSAAFILLSINFIIQKNKELIFNLYNIGYNHKKIALFYQAVISAITVVSIASAMAVGLIIRNYYQSTFVRLFEFESSGNKIFLIGAILLVVLLLSYNFLLLKSIKKTVVVRKEKVGCS